MKWIKTQEYETEYRIIKSELRNCEYIKSLFITQKYHDIIHSNDYKIYCPDGCLGIYSTEDKAQKVYEMICDFLNNKNETMFIMPQDNEVG